ncbi:hypothetical protein LY76DRAFT_299355 [Colletotrichum caudatum]|nr:hypothetical protein LY76DRAFT_299355 [Colletotrichum caudatum]
MRRRGKRGGAGRGSVGNSSPGPSKRFPHGGGQTRTPSISDFTALSRVLLARLLWALSAGSRFCVHLTEKQRLQSPPPPSQDTVSSTTGSHPRTSDRDFFRRLYQPLILKPLCLHLLAASATDTFSNNPGLDTDICLPNQSQASPPTTNRIHSHKPGYPTYPTSNLTP